MFINVLYKFKNKCFLSHELSYQQQIKWEEKQSLKSKKSDFDTSIPFVVVKKVQIEKIFNIEIIHKSILNCPI